MNEFISKIKNSASMELMAKAQEMKARGLDIISTEATRREYPGASGSAW